MRDGGIPIVVILLIALAIAILIARSYFKKVEFEKSRLASATKTNENLYSQLSDLKKDRAATIATKDAEIAQKSHLVEGLTKIIDQRKSQFPWLASAIADFYALISERDAKYLENKSHPATRSAEVVREYGKKQRDAIRESRLMRSRVEYYEKIFPWISDYVGDDVPDAAVDVSGVETGADVPRVKPVLCTSTKVSDVARDVAKVLDVTIHEHVRISDYPMIKCNLSTRDGQKIYHLPFDQQYDRVKIKHEGEKYVYAITDAETLGFRRAWKWRPEAS